MSHYDLELFQLFLSCFFRYDPETGFATVQAGCRLADLDYELMAHGRSVPFGIVGLTGIAGLALHGGIGFLTRRHGLTADNIMQVEIVPASGMIP